MLKCNKCGFDNELGRIFCHQCGSKLDLNQIKPPSRGGPKIRRKGRMTPARFARIIIELIFLLAVLWAVYLACQVPELRPFQPTNAQLLAADDKRLVLEQMVQQGRAASVEVTATELNAFISSMSFEKSKGAGMEVVPVTLRADLEDGMVELSFIGELHAGDVLSKKLSITYTGVPTVEDGAFEFQPVSASVGELPIHPAILQATPFVQNVFERLFSRLNNERSVLDQLSSIEVHHDRVVLTYTPKSGSH
jgi:hypothetical protein